MGAITNRSISFRGRPWEYQSIIISNIYDTYCYLIKLDLRNCEIMRVLPCFLKGIRFWITNTTRFNYINLNYNHGIFCYFIKNTSNVSWSRATIFINFIFLFYFKLSLISLFCFILKKIKEKKQSVKHDSYFWLLKDNINLKNLKTITNLSNNWFGYFSTCNSNLKNIIDFNCFSVFLHCDNNDKFLTLDYSYVHLLPLCFNNKFNIKYDFFNKYFYFFCINNSLYNSFIIILNIFLLFFVSKLSLLFRNFFFFISIKEFHKIKPILKKSKHFFFKYYIDSLSDLNDSFVLPKISKNILYKKDIVFDKFLFIYTSIIKLDKNIIMNKFKSNFFFIYSLFNYNIKGIYLMSKDILNTNSYFINVKGDLIINEIKIKNRDSNCKSMNNFFANILAQDKPFAKI